CDIWSCGMVNSSGSFEFLALPELAAARDPEPWQPPSANIIADTAAHTATLCQIWLRTFMAGSSSLPLPSTAPARSYRRQVPGDRPTERIGSCARHRENPTGWQRRVYTHTR